MLSASEAFSGFGVDDLDAARDFYGSTLGLEVEVGSEGPQRLMTLHLAGGRDVFVYESPGMTAPSYTILNFPVDDVEATVDALAERGVRCERYEGFDQDEKGIMRGAGPTIAWFRDPAGNTLSVIETP